MLIAGPDTRVIELRVHGVMGTTPESLVDAVVAVDVAGDGVGRIVRPADRLRRPAPGPVLHAGGRPVPRTVEGYLWSAMTSGGFAKAAWALLLPFSLANMAHWMLPPTGRVLGGTLRSLVRLAALVLTMLLVTQLTVVSLDLVAGQWLDQFSQLRPWRAPIGLAPVLIVVALLHKLSAIDWKVHTPSPAPQRDLLPGARIAADPDAPALHVLHATAGLACAALLAAGGPFGASSDRVFVVWIAAWALILLSVLITLALDAPTEGRWFKPWARRLLVVATLLEFVAAGALAPMPSHGQHLPGTDPTVQSIAGVLGVTVVAFALVLIPAAVLARGGWSQLPPSLRPWAGGWMAAPMLVIASLLGGGFGAGVGITVQKALGDDSLQLPPGYRYVTTLWGVAAVLAVVVGLVGALVLVLPRGTKPIEIDLLHPGKPEDAKHAAQAWRLARLERKHAHHVFLVAAAVLSAGTVASVLMQIRGVELPWWGQPLPGIGITALGAFAIGLLRLVYVATKSPDTARQLGLLNDIAGFWPREAHPLVPPCYALKAIPELVARAQEHLADPGTRVVLAGYSQGSLLATIAAARLLDSLPAHERERVGLVTAGSPLQWAYPRAFPAVVSHDSLAELAKAMNGRWRAVCRGTDAIGGGVTTWERLAFDGQLLGVGFEGALPAAERSPNGALVLGGDHWLPDPQRGPIAGRRWRPGVLRHRDYTSDPEWDHAIAAAAGLDVAEAPLTLWNFKH
ncbi:membrane protein [Kutzneria kofuensis]